MPNENKQPLTSAEIADLWTLYVFDTLIICFKKYAIAKAEDKEIRAILQEALNISVKRLQDIASIFSSDNIPIPVGFSDKDIDIETPRLFSDTLALFHVFSRTKFALTLVSIALFMAVRPDVRKLYQNALTTSSKLNEDATKVALTKGLLIYSPIVIVPQTPHFVEKSSYLGSLLGKNHPMHVSSAKNLFLTIQENVIGRAFITGFSQVAHDPEVREYFTRGAEICTKHIKVCSSLLGDEDIPIPQSPDSMVTDSTVPPFSDYFMINHILAVNAFSLADMGIAIAQSLRKDIATAYTRLAAEAIQYAEDGIHIMIKNRWLEAPPQVVSHKELASSGKTK